MDAPGRPTGACATGIRPGGKPRQPGAFLGRCSRSLTAAARTRAGLPAGRVQASQFDGVGGKKGAPGGATGYACRRCCAGRARIVGRCAAQLLVGASAVRPVARSSGSLHAPMDCMRAPMARSCSSYRTRRAAMKKIMCKLISCVAAPPVCFRH